MKNDIVPIRHIHIQVHALIHRLCINEKYGIHIAVTH